MKTKTQGFTLIELIVVISIITVLAALAYISLSGEAGSARDARRQSDLKTLENAISMSNAQNTSLSYPSTTITTGTGAGDTIATTSGNVRVLRNATAFQLADGFVNSTIIATIPRDPKGSPYFAAFINSNQFQLISTLENSTTKIPEAHIVGTFKTEAVVDNILSAIDNNDLLLAVGNAGQFIRGDVIQIDSEKMLVTDVSTNSGGADEEVILVTRGYDSTTAVLHKDRAAIKLVSFAANASSLYCLGALEELTNTDNHGTGTASALNAADVPDDLSVTLASITLENTYTCSASGNVSNKGTVVVYDVASQ